MFLYLLNENQKAAFFDIAHQVIFVDRRLANAETTYLNQLVSEAGMHQTPLASNDPISVLVQVFDNRNSRLAVAIEVVALAIVDSEYHRLEDEFADELFEAFGLADDDHEYVNRIAEHVAAAAVAMWEIGDVEE